jgi:regulator of protease activity HflC (stomatin/prohibitin superfamily)
MKKSLIKWIVLGIILIVAVSLGLNCCSSVGPTEKGVMLTFGKPSDESLDPGLHFKSPIGQEIRTWDLSPIEYSKTFSVGQDGAISKDMQTIGVTFTLYWKYDPDRISEIARNFSNEQKIYQPLSTAAKAALKAEIGKYSVEEIIQNQAKITENVRSTFESDKDISNLPIIIQSLKIDNWDWDDSYEKMIKATMTRKQEVEQMKQEVALSEQAAQKQVKEAEAEKQRIELESEAALIKAQKEAEANIARAEGEAQAKKVKAEADRYEAEQIARAAEMKKAQWKHEENILELQAKLEHEKSWDGKLPPNYIPIAANGTIVSLPAGQNQ